MFCDYDLFKAGEGQTKGILNLGFLLIYTWVIVLDVNKIEFHLLVVVAM